MLQLEALKETERHQKLLGVFQEWRDAFELIEASNLPKLLKCIGILKKYRKDKTSYKDKMTDLYLHRGPNKNYTTVAEPYCYEEFMGT